MEPKAKKISKYPLDSFGPELMALLIKGSREKVVLRFNLPNGEGKKRAHKFQQRVHTLRSRMRQENHPDYPIAAKTIVSMFWGDKAVLEGAPKEWQGDSFGKLGALIIARPRDSEFTDVLREAGISVEPRPQPKPVVVNTSADEEASLDAFMDELEGESDEEASTS